MTEPKKPWHWMSGSPLGSLAKQNDHVVERVSDIGEKRRNLLSDHRSGYISVAELQEGLKALKETGK